MAFKFKAKEILGVTGTFSKSLTISGVSVLTGDTSSFLTSSSNVVYTTGNQTVSGLKTFANNLEVSGYGNFSNSLYINNSRVATEDELTKKMIAFAIALG